MAILRKQRFKSIRPWTQAVAAARRQLNIVGFVPLGGKSLQGIELLKKSKDTRSCLAH